MAFSAIDPQLLASMITDMSRGAQLLRQQCGSLRPQYDRYGVDASALGELDQVAAWIDAELPLLRRRQVLTQAMDGAQASGFVVLVEPVRLSAAGAHALGARLAGRVNDLHRTDRASAEELHRVALELAQYRDDPDVAGAFYAGLYPRQRLLALPNLLYSSGSTTAREDWQVFSEAFGAAVSAEYPAPGFEAVKEWFTEPVDRENVALAWNRGAYLAHGTFPAGWLAQVARANALDEFARDPERDWRGGGPTAPTLGLPQDTVALYLTALGRNGEAARDAITNMGYPDHGHLRRENIETLLASSRLNDDRADALGEALAAGAGVGGETTGNHTSSASAFALDTIVTVGHHEGDVEWVMKDSMGRIAASYAPELVTGSRQDDGASRDSNSHRPANFDKIPGLEPQFYLSPSDTYRFLKTFAEQDAMSEAFDKTMGDLQQQVFRAAAQADADAIHRGQQDPRNFEKAVAAFGGLAGLEHQAQLKVRTDMDEFDQRMRGIMKDLLTVGLIDRLPGGRHLGDFAWESMKFAAGKQLDGWVGDGDTRVEALYDEDLAVLQAGRYNMAITLIDAGWELSSRPRPPFAENGRVLPFAELANDPRKLDAFNDWLDESDGSAVSFDEKGDHANFAFEGAVRKAESVAASVNGDN